MLPVPGSERVRNLRDECRGSGGSEIVFELGYVVARQRCSRWDFTAGRNDEECMKDVASVAEVSNRMVCRKVLEDAGHVLPDFDLLVWIEVATEAIDRVVNRSGIGVAENSLVGLDTLYEIGRECCVSYRAQLQVGKVDVSFSHGSKLARRVG